MPIYAVNEEDGRVFGAIVGAINKDLIVQFPPTKFDQSSFMAQRYELDRIAVYKRGDWDGVLLRENQKDQ